MRQKIQFVTEANYFDEVAYILRIGQAVSNAPTDMVFATGTTLGVSERVKIASNGSLRLTLKVALLIQMLELILVVTTLD